MGWLGTSRGRRRVALSFGGGAMALVISFNRSFTMVLVATTPLHLLWPTAYLWEFDGSTFSGSIGAAPVALYAWHGTESFQARSDRAETGLIGRSPTGSVGTCRIHTHRRGTGGSIGLGSGGCMGREGGEILGLRVLKSVRSAELESERSRGVSEGPTPEHLFVVFQTCCEALGKCCAGTH